jgi:peptidoglycan/xylan/chitin deacetylase (PgdA/CDA1 family)
VVLLKLDDVVQYRKPPAPVSPRWQRVTDFLAQQHLKVGFGIICESLEQPSPAYVKWIQDLQQSGQIEFWCHGYHMKNASEPGEFEQGTAEEQAAIFRKCEKLAQDKLGFPLPAFGPHWSGTTEATDAALETVPEIKIWLYGPAKPKHFTRLSLERVMALENPTFVPDPAKFKPFYERNGAKQKVLVLQGHPDQWDDQRWAGFLEIIEFLKSKGAKFSTPSEYLKLVLVASAPRR